jgi:hypothetical protein
MRCLPCGLVLCFALGIVGISAQERVGFTSRSPSTRIRSCLVILVGRTSIDWTASNRSRWRLIRVARRGPVGRKPLTRGC